MEEVHDNDFDDFRLFIVRRLALSTPDLGTDKLCSGKHGRTSFSTTDQTVLQRAWAQTIQRRTTDRRDISNSGITRLRTQSDLVAARNPNSPSEAPSGVCLRQAQLLRAKARAILSRMLPRATRRIR